MSLAKYHHSLYSLDPGGCCGKSELSEHYQNITKSFCRLARVLLLGLLSSAGIAMLRFGTMSASSVPTAVCRGIVGLGLLALGLDIRRRGKIIDAQEGKAVFEYYMHVWKIFYACYIMLPFIR